MKFEEMEHSKLIEYAYSLEADNIRYLQMIARGEEPKAPKDDSDLAAFINEMAMDGEATDLTTNITISQWLWQWLPHLRAMRQAGLCLDFEDYDEQDPAMVNSDKVC